MATTAVPTAASTAWETGSPPDSTPWGKPHGWKMVIPGVWQVHTTSHGGWWLTNQRLKAMPDDLAAQNWNGMGRWFEEDSDTNLVVRAFPDEFDSETKGYAERDRLWRERNARLDAAKTSDDIKSALIVRPDDFQPKAHALALAEAATGGLTIVMDASNRLAIVRGYDATQKNFADVRAPTIGDCIATELQPEDLLGTSYAFLVYQPVANKKRWLPSTTNMGNDE